MIKIKKIQRRFGMLIVLTMIMILMSTPVWADTARVSVEKISYPVISLTGVNKERAVTWWAQKDAKNAEVHYGTDSKLNKKKVVSGKQSYRAEGASSKYAGFASFETVLKGLKKNTKYYYQVKVEVGGKKETSKIYSFHTGDGRKANKTFDFIYMGDAQPAGSITEDYDKWLNLLKEAKSQKKDIAFTMMNGDMVNTGQNAYEWNEYLKRASEVFQTMPVMTIPGNHESSDSETYKPELYMDFLAMPKNGPKGFEEEFYSFDYGNCHILAVNSYVFKQYDKKRITDQDMERIEKWMAKDLENATADFNIVVTHHPAYAAVDDYYAEQVLENWAPIFEGQDVDLILCGHQHVYMRTKAMRGGKEDKENGVVSIMGVSGSKWYNETSVDYAEVMRGHVSNYQLLSVNKDKLTITAKDGKGNSLDKITLKSKEKKRVKAAKEKAKKLLGKQEGVQAKAAAYNKVKVSWSKNEYATGYRLYEAKGSSGKYKRVADTKKTSYVRNKRLTGSTYKYKVRAYKKVKGEIVFGGFSDVKSTKPALKKNNVKVKAKKGSVTVQWSKVKGASRYKVYRSLKKDSGYKKVKTLKSNTRTYTDKKIKKGKTYYYKVRAYRYVNGKRVYSPYSTPKAVKSK